MLGAVLTLLLVTPPPAKAGHEIHVSYGRVSVEAKTVTIRLRMFKDDLSRALARHHQRDTVDVEARPLADSLALAYLGQKLLVSLDGKPLVGRITGAGSEDKMWWYLLEYPMAARGERLSLANRVFFELFENQQNLLKVIQAGSGEETSLYFVPGEPGPVVLGTRRSALGTRPRG